jgi:hypothetical protein
LAPDWAHFKLLRWALSNVSKDERALILNKIPALERLESFARTQKRQPEMHPPDLN